MFDVHLSKKRSVTDEPCRLYPQTGLSLIELLMALAVTAVLVVALGGVIDRALQTQNTVQDKNNLLREAEFAMQRVVYAVGRSRLLILPLGDSVLTPHNESIREPGVLAVTVDVLQDLDADGYPDADNDEDGHIDEDLPEDTSNDGKAGLLGIDDNNNGFVDDSFAGKKDDDEGGVFGNDDAIDGVDNDGDGLKDEDPPADINGDGAPGIAGVDDDGDGSVDEGSVEDDDEDGQSNEDWYDAVVFYLNGSNLIERTPVPWDENTDGSLTGQDYVESSIADNVTRFRVERLAPNGANAQLVDITLQLTSPSTGETVSLNTRVRVGEAL